MLFFRSPTSGESARGQFADKSMNRVTYRHIRDFLRIKSLIFLVIIGCHFKSI